MKTRTSQIWRCHARAFREDPSVHTCGKSSAKLLSSVDILLSAIHFAKERISVWFRSENFQWSTKTVSFSLVLFLPCSTSAPRSKTQQILVLLPFHPETCSPSDLTNPLVAYELAMLLEEKPTAVDRLRWIAAVLRLNNVGSVFPLCQLCSGSGSIPTLADTSTVHRRQLRQWDTHYCLAFSAPSRRYNQRTPSRGSAIPTAASVVVTCWSLPRLFHLWSQHGSTRWHIPHCHLRCPYGLWVLRLLKPWCLTKAFVRLLRSYILRQEARSLTWITQNGRSPFDVGLGLLVWTCGSPYSLIRCGKHSLLGSAVYYRYITSQIQ